MGARLPDWNYEPGDVYIPQPDGIYGDAWPYEYEPCKYCGRLDDPNKFGLCLGCRAYRIKKLPRKSIVDRVLRYLDLK